MRSVPSRYVDCGGLWPVILVYKRHRISPYYATRKCTSLLISNDPPLLSLQNERPDSPPPAGVSRPPRPSTSWSGVRTPKAAIGHRQQMPKPHHPQQLVVVGG